METRGMGSRSTIVTCSRTEQGIREKNEDACGIFSIPLTCRDFRPLAVADGLGGHPAGEVASALAVRALAQSVSLLAGSRDMQDVGTSRRDPRQVFPMRTTGCVGAFPGRTPRAWEWERPPLPPPPHRAGRGGLVKRRRQPGLPGRQGHPEDNKRTYRGPGPGGPGHGPAEPGAKAPPPEHRHQDNRESGRYTGFLPVLLDDDRLILCSDGLLDGLRRSRDPSPCQHDRVSDLCEVLPQRHAPGAGTISPLSQRGVPEIRGNHFFDPGAAVTIRTASTISGSISIWKVYHHLAVFDPRVFPGPVRPKGVVRLPREVRAHASAQTDWIPENSEVILPPSRNSGLGA